MRRALGLVALLLLALAACAGEEEPTTAPSVTDTPTSTDTPTPTRTTRTTTPTPTVLKVGMQTACTLYFSDDLAQRAVDPITQIVAHPDGSTIDVEEVESIIDELRNIEARAPMQLAVQLGAMAGVLEELVDVFSTGVNQTLRTGDFQAANIEVIFQCGDAGS